MTPSALQRLPALLVAIASCALFALATSHATSQHVCAPYARAVRSSARDETAARAAYVAAVRMPPTAAARAARMRAAWSRDEAIEQPPR